MSHLHTGGLVSGHLTCGACPVRHKAVCSLCDKAELEMLGQVKYYRSFKAGESIVWGGEDMEFVASLVTGIATLSQSMADGRRQMVGLLLPSDFIGHPGRQRAPFDVTAATDVMLCCFRKSPFEKILLTTPHIAIRLLERTLDEIDAAREWMLVLGRKSAREKIASLLTIMAQREASLHLARIRRNVIVELPLTRDQMADYLGLTLETVSRQMSALKRDGVIELLGKRQIAIPDFAHLVDETGDDGDGGWVD